jgi:hypothetical protein
MQDSSTVTNLMVLRRNALQNMHHIEYMSGSLGYEKQQRTDLKNMYSTHHHYCH